MLEHIVTYDIDHKELLVINLGVGKAGRVWSDSLARMDDLILG